MKPFLFTAALAAALLVCGCQNSNHATHSNRAPDDRPHNAESQRFEARTQGSNTDTTRQFKDRGVHPPAN